MSQIAKRMKDVESIQECLNKIQMSSKHLLGIMKVSEASMNFNKTLKENLGDLGIALNRSRKQYSIVMPYVDLIIGCK